MEKLVYPKNRSAYPVPESEKGLPSVTAELFAEIPMDGVRPGLNILEGICFDRRGDMYLVNCPMGRIYKIDMQEGSVHLFRQLPEHMAPSAVKIHKDGRIFATVAASDHGSMIIVLDPDNAEIIGRIWEDNGHMIDDMVFDPKGGFYCTDLEGTAADPCAGIFYIEPDEKTVHPVIASGMAATNGIGLSLDGRNLYVTEFSRALLHRIGLSEDGLSPAPCETNVLYHFTGYEGPDSLCMDRDENLYVAMCGQGRFLVFSHFGVPIGQILIPGRDDGRMLKSTHIQIRPGTTEAYMCTADMETGKSAVYRAQVFAEPFPGFQYQ
ncbi:MAG: SMP-30/gluconolactonase/LRE family protein [Oscillospiraceae bacterium]|jgi:lactonase